MVVIMLEGGCGQDNYIMVVQKRIKLIGVRCWLSFKDLVLGIYFYQ